MEVVDPAKQFFERQVRFETLLVQTREFVTTKYQAGVITFKERSIIMTKLRSMVAKIYASGSEEELKALRRDLQKIWENRLGKSHRL